MFFLLDRNDGYYYNAIGTSNSWSILPIEIRFPLSAGQGNACEGGDSSFWWRRHWKSQLCLRILSIGSKQGGSSPVVLLLLAMIVNPINNVSIKHIPFQTENLLVIVLFSHYHFFFQMLCTRCLRYLLTDLNHFFSRIIGHAMNFICEKKI